MFADLLRAALSRGPDVTDRSPASYFSGSPCASSAIATGFCSCGRRLSDGFRSMTECVHVDPLGRSPSRVMKKGRATAAPSSEAPRSRSAQGSCESRAVNDYLEFSDANFAPQFSAAKSVANPMDLTALNGRVANTWKAKIRS